MVGGGRSVCSSGAGERAPSSLLDRSRRGWGSSHTVRAARVDGQGLIRVAGARDEPLVTSQQFRARRRAVTRDGLAVATYAALRITRGIISDIGPRVLDRPRTAARRVRGFC